MSKQKLLLIPVFAIILGWIYLSYLESFNYDNYVFTRFHLNLARYSFIPGLLLGLWIIYYLLKKKTNKFLVILFFVFCLVSVPGGIKATGQVIARTHQVFLGNSYIIHKSKSSVFGNDYKFIEFIKDYLDDQGEVVITLPPNTLPWRHTGNYQIMDSLFYPLTTTNLFGETPYVLISSEADGAEYHLWPDFKIPAEKIIIYDWENNKAITIDNKDWDPEEWQDKNPWGLIIRK